ncbi:MAG: hypothetical protein WCC92_04260 [Candidatus Korobacteraceae bacterium]
MSIVDSAELGEDHRALALVHRQHGAEIGSYPPVKVITNVGTILFLVVAMLLTYKSILGAIGSRAFAAQILFVLGLTFGGFYLGSGSTRQQKMVLSLGICTRNIGAPGAVVGTNGPPEIVAMLIIGMFLTVAGSFGAAAWFVRRSRKKKQLAETEELATVGVGKA